MRVKTRWNNKSKPHSIQDIASAMGFNTWRIACNGVLNLENEGFQTDTQRFKELRPGALEIPEVIGIIDDTAAVRVLIINLHTDVMVMVHLGNIVPVISFSISL